MNAQLIAVNVARILRQLRHDRPTIAMIVLMPIVLLTLVRFMFDGAGPAFQRVALVLLGVFPFVLMFLITSIAMLRERSSGTLERLFTTKIGKLDLLFSYGIAFALAAAAQGTIASLLATWLLGLDPAGPLYLVIVIAVANAVLGVALGLLCSAFARTEFQAVQFMPAVAFPQVFLCGLFVPREQMASGLQWLSNIMPMTYSVDALVTVGATATPDTGLWWDLIIIAGVIIVALTLGALTLRRQAR